MVGTIATPDYCLAAGEIVDVPRDLAKELIATRINARLSADTGETLEEHFAAVPVTDPKEREKAKPFRLHQTEEEEETEGWLKGGSR